MRNAPPNSVRQVGFTLTELLVSIALVAILMLAANAIFRTTADTVGSGQAVSTGLRDLRTVQTTMRRDLENVAMDGPFLMIRSSIGPAFLNAKDQQGDRDYTETANSSELANILSADPARSGTETAQAVTSYGIRTFRQDILGFFSRGLFRRQTGNDGVFAAPMSSNEAYVWYGHLKLPDNSGTSYVWPGYTDNAANYWNAATNPNNFYASQWMWGRVAILLKGPVGGPITDDTGAAQAFIDGPTGSCGPLSMNCQTGGVALANAPWRVQDSRLDLADTTIADYRVVIANNQTATTWTTANTFSYRFQANPFPSRPFNAAKAAQTVPILLSNCSQFIVEYAGDFVKQDSAGNVTDVCWDYTTTPPGPKATDNEVDFDIVNGVKKIHWYGMPRASAGDGNIDVTPLRDRWQVADATHQAPFEKYITFARQANPNSYVGNLAVTDRYTVVWEPTISGVSKPMMLRILVKAEDPGGRTDLPWQEMIFTLPQ